MTKAVVCREMGWTYAEFDDQPYPFIVTILTMLRSESKAASKRHGQ